MGPDSVPCGKLLCAEPREPSGPYSDDSLRSARTYEDQDDRLWVPYVRFDDV